MFEQSVIKKSGQWWKAVLSIVALTGGGSQCSMAFLTVRYFSRFLLECFWVHLVLRSPAPQSVVLLVALDGYGSVLRVRV